MTVSLTCIFAMSLIYCLYYYDNMHNYYSPFQLTSLIYVEKFEFENPAIMEDKQCKQMERFSVMTKGRDYFLS